MFTDLGVPQIVPYIIIIITLSPPPSLLLLKHNLTYILDFNQFLLTRQTGLQLFQKSLPLMPTILWRNKL
jgi:hypothetical protein